MADSHARRRYTIVGIDPGTTVGIAMIDLLGKPVEVFSAKNYSISDTIAWIAARGRPLIVASDVTPTPAMVKKISSVFASPVHDLDESLSTDEKIALTKGEDYEYKNAHERDALAACVNAFRHYKRKFTQVQKKTPAGVNVEAVKAMVVKGVSISAAIDRLIAPEEAKEQVTEEPRQSEGDSGVERERESKTILRLRGLLKDKDARIELLEERMKALETRLEEEERERERLKRRLNSTRSASTRELKKAEEIRKRDRAIESLRAEVSAREHEKAELRRIIDDLKGRGKREVRGGKRITVIQAFSHDAILDADRKYGLKKGDVVFLKDGSGGGTSTAELLAKKGVVAVIYGGELSHFAADTFSQFDIPAFSTHELPLLSTGDEDEEEGEGAFAFVNPHLLNERMEEWKRARREKKVVLLHR
jgi:predicted RNase H-like nuclease (RuvC/YqgF family)